MVPERSAVYFSSIDGLRALAVTFVLAFHAGFPWASGGFIGVDVFFVVSGFLITGNILRALQSGEWSFATFYAKRVARLLPPLIVVILLTLFAGYFILSPDDLVQLGEEGFLSSVSLSNIAFWMGSGYFDTSADVKPLLHTWSLSVEEQFYLVWPVLIAGAFWLRGIPGVLLALFALCLGSLIAAYAVEVIDPSAVFFLTPFRAYQFAFGALLALAGSLGNSHIRAAGAWLSILALGWLCFSLEGDRAGLFAAATAPAIATAAFIWGSEARVVRSVFEAAPLRWLGRRSYSIYLVHWPIMVYWRLATDYQLSPVEGATSCGLSIVAGAILYELIERRFRFPPKVSFARKASTLAGVACSLIIIGLVGALYAHSQGFPSRLPAEIIEAAANLKPEWDARLAAVRTGTCNIILDQHEASDFDLAVCADPPADRRSFMVLGDSYASGTYLVFEEAFPEVYFGQLTIPGCRPTLPKHFQGDSRPKCRELYRLAFEDVLAGGKFDGVVLAANWLDVHFGEVDAIVRNLTRWGLEVVLVGQRPSFHERVPNIVLASANFESANARAQSLLDVTRFRINERFQRKFADEAVIVDLMTLLCAPECSVFDGIGQLIYLDQSHLSLAGIKLVAHRLRERYPDLLSAPHIRPDRQVSPALETPYALH